MSVFVTRDGGRHGFSLCDVIWAPLECNNTSENPDDVMAQLRAGSPEFTYWIKFQSIAFSM